MKRMIVVDERKIKRINELTAISKERELTADEQKERQALRDEYRASFRASLLGQFDNTYIVRPDGTKEKIKKKD